MDLSLERWRTLSHSEREALVKQIHSELPTGFEFEALIGNNAFFRSGAAQFVFIPGRRITLGFDAGRRWEPTPQETESWEHTARQYGFSGTIHDHGLELTLRPREVEIAPILIETSARELAWKTIEVDGEIKKLVKKYPDGVHHICRGETETRVRKNSDGSLSAERSLERTHGDLIEEFKAAGFRFPTSDEWEYACGCGEPTLFRWGDHAPCDRYPLGKIKSPVGEFGADWNLHLKPNSLGISIASNPYHCELTAEMGVTRGGDGGFKLCGGSGFFVGWLTLATAYFEEHFCRHEADEKIPAGYTVGRRVLDLNA